MLAENGCLIFTTPDAAEWGRVQKYYQNWRDIPPFTGQDEVWIVDHIWQYSQEEIEEIIFLAGLSIEKFAFSPSSTGRHLCYKLVRNESKVS